MKVKYFDDTDTLYIEFRESDIAESKDLDENTVLDVDADGGMQSRSVWAELGEATPDGVCLDAEGALWVASPGTGARTTCRT